MALTSITVTSGATVNARLAATILRHLDARRARVAFSESMGATQLHVGAADGSWTLTVAGMRTGHGYEDPTRRIGTADLAGRRRR